MHDPNKIIEKTETDRMIVGLRQDGVVHVYYKDNTCIDVQLQEELIAVLNAMFQGREKCYIYEAGKNCSVNKEARENAIVIEPRKPSIAVAVYVQNPVYRMIARFYYKFNKPQKPFLVVSDFSQGIEWLNRFMSESASA